jgi:hypothetical protein
MTRFEMSADTDRDLEKELGPGARKGTVTIDAGDRGRDQETDLNGIEDIVTTVAADRPIIGGIVTIENATTSQEDDQRWQFVGVFRRFYVPWDLCTRFRRNNARDTVFL